MPQENKQRRKKNTLMHAECFQLFINSVILKREFVIADSDATLVIINAKQTNMVAMLRNF